ncbi:MAG: hypothetical protein EBY29_00025 [Planctomycetes bacterium]|nr:hypothetical protein [Planctomycetota bacterium]
MTRTPGEVNVLEVGADEEPQNGTRRSRLGLSPLLDGIRNVCEVVDGIVATGAAASYAWAVVTAIRPLVRYEGCSVAIVMSVAIVFL